MIQKTVMEALQLGWKLDHIWQLVSDEDYDIDPAKVIS